MSNVIPLSRVCGVCDGVKIVALGGGSRVEFHDCPACVGIDPASITGEERDDIETICRREGVAAVWKVPA